MSRVMWSWCLVSVFQIGKLDAIHAQERIVTVNGTVTDATSGRTLSAVSVLYDGSVVTITDDEGRYEFRLPISVARFDIAFRRIGFRQHAEARDVPDSGVLSIDVSLEPIPTVLEEITVDGRQITIRNPGLVGFYERRELAYGRFLTEEEIGRAIGFDMSNLFRRLRMPRSCNEITPLVAYLDGVRVIDMPDGEGGLVSGVQRIDDLIPPSQVGGIEYYPFASAVRLPREFIPAGPYCGVVMFWTREPKGPSSATLTAHLGSLVGRDANSRFAVGAGFGFPLRSQSTLRFDTSAQVPLERSADLWRVFIQSTGRPFGQTSPWYVGLGVVVIKPRGSLGGSAVTSVDASPVLVSGFRLFDTPLNPFIELRVLDPTSPDQMTGVVVTGVNLDLGGGN